MSSIGAIINATPDLRRYSNLDDWGIGVVVVGILFFGAELFRVFNPLTKSQLGKQVDGQ